MVDWKAPDEISKDSGEYRSRWRVHNAVFRRFDSVVVVWKLTGALAGVYIWEFLASVNYDWEYVTGVRKFRPPMVRVRVIQ